MYGYTGARRPADAAEAVIEAGGGGVQPQYLAANLRQHRSSETVKLYTHFIVREDAQILYGFYSLAEREVFRALIGVSGVGGNTARMILSTFSSDEVRTIISTGQADVLKSVKGLGIKTAQKIIVELRDKLGVLPGGDAQLPMQAAGGESFAEALSALMMLGLPNRPPKRCCAHWSKNSPWRRSKS